MENKELFQKIFEYYTSSKYDPSEEILTFDYNSEFQSFLDTNCIHYNKNSSKIFIGKKELPFQLFITDSEFYRRCSEKDFSNDIFIINSSSDYRAYIDKKTYKNNIALDNNYFFTNIISYVNFRKIFLLEMNNSAVSLPLIDFHNSTFRTIYFYSLKDNRKLEVEYTSKIPGMEESVNYEPNYKALEKILKNTDNNYILFLKNAIIDFLKDKPVNKRFEELFYHIQSIIHNADLDFNIYLSNLSIDRLKKDYNEYKNKYFSSLNELLNKISAYILALPISVFGTALATNKINDAPLIFWIIFAVIVVLLLYIPLIIKYYDEEINFININVEKEYTILEENSFFKKFPNELEEFSSIKSLITKKKISLKIILHSYFLLNQIVNTLLLLYIFGKIDSSSGLTAVVISFCAIISVFFYLRIFFKKQNFNSPVQ